MLFDFNFSTKKSLLVCFSLQRERRSVLPDLPPDKIDAFPGKQWRNSGLQELTLGTGLGFLNS
jgi:hypothetical protein